MKAKNLIWIGAVIIAAIIAWYLISPAFRVIEADEPSPVQVKDALETMSEEEKQEFDRAVADAADDAKQMDEPMPSEPKAILNGEFKPRAHEVEGSAKVIQSDGTHTLRFEGFETINGPDLYIYLSSELGDDDYVDLGRIKATKGNVNYEIPEGTDLEKYNKVLVWCRPFGILFSYAELK